MAFWFDTTITPLAINSNQELSLALGTKTLVKLTGTTSVHIFGLAQIGGNVDGAVVTFLNVSGASLCTFAFDHESSSASALVNRFRNPSFVAMSTGTFWGGVSYRYDASAQRWRFLSRS